jgi:hypothetical protein
MKKFLKTRSNRAATAQQPRSNRAATAQQPQMVAVDGFVFYFVCLW